MLHDVLGYFISMSNALDVKVRTNSVNDKITYAAEVRSRYSFGFCLHSLRIVQAQSVLRQLLTEVRFFPFSFLSFATLIGGFRSLPRTAWNLLS